MLLPWILAHLFEIIGMIGTVASIVFAGLAVRANTREQRIANLAQAVKEHREIWSVLYRKPELKRIFDSVPGQEGVVPTLHERLFLKSLFLHFGAMFRKQKLGMTFPESGLAADVRQFFSKPIPRKVWEEMKPFQEPDFVELVESHIQNHVRAK